jgi:DNA-binding NtrC family response regulator
MVSMAKILILDECPSTRNLLVEELAGMGNIVLSTGVPDLISGIFQAFNPELVILDLLVKGKYRWDLLEEIKACKPHLAVFLYSWDSSMRESHPPQIDGFITMASIYRNSINGYRKYRCSPGLRLTCG